MNFHIEIQKNIIHLRKEYLENNITDSHYHINDGLCEDFALEVIKRLNGYTDDFYELSNHCFMIGEDGDECENDIWDKNLLETHWNTTPPCGVSWAQINEIPFGTHVWIHYKGMHYDSECSEGVSNFFELPLFKRYIIQYCTEHNISHTENVQIN